MHFLIMRPLFQTCAFLELVCSFEFTKTIVTDNLTSLSPTL